jgi:anti-sigma B factor antagonist
MPLTVTVDGALVTLQVDGAIDSHLGTELSVAAATALGEGQQRFLLSLQRAKQANSAGLEALVQTAQTLRDAGARLALVGPSAVLADILKATRLDRRFAIFESTEQAMVGLQREH